MNISEMLSLRAGDAIAVVGCGGKTSLVNRLAEKNKAKKVLVAPTTKIRPMAGDGIVFLTGRDAYLSHMPQPGIHCFGTLNPDTGKLSALPTKDIASIKNRYDIVLMEADGSRSLPCKGWLSNEPAVPAFATKTVAVVTLLGLGMPADEDHVLRLPEFCALAGLAPGDTITLDALATMVAAPGGMLKNATGEVFLLINRVEDAAGFQRAKELAELIRQKNPDGVGRFFAGSVLNDDLKEI